MGTTIAPTAIVAYTRPICLRVNLSVSRYWPSTTHHAPQMANSRKLSTESGRRSSGLNGGVSAANSKALKSTASLQGVWVTGWGF